MFIDQVLLNTITLNADGKFVVQSAPLSSAGESCLMIEQWYKASSQLVEMCSKYLNVGSGCVAYHMTVTAAEEGHVYRLVDVLTLRSVTCGELPHISIIYSFGQSSHPNSRCT